MTQSSPTGHATRLEVASAMDSDLRQRVARAASTRAFEELEHSITASAGNCLFHAWRGVGRVQAQDMAVLSSCAHTLAKTYPEGFAKIVILMPNVALPTPDERARLEEFYAVHAGSLRAVACVVLGSGFWAGAMRGMLTALHGNKPYATRVLPSAREALAWIGTGPALPLSDPKRASDTLNRLQLRLAASLSHYPPGRTPL